MTVMNRGTSNSAVRGSAEARRRRKQYLLETYRADQDAAYEDVEIGDETFTMLKGVWLGTGEPACRCYRCGTLLVFETLQVDRIIPGCKGGTYRRENIRPACGPCNRITGNQLRWEGRS